MCTDQRSCVYHDSSIEFNLIQKNVLVLFVLRDLVTRETMFYVMRIKHLHQRIFTDTLLTLRRFICIVRVTTKIGLLYEQMTAKGLPNGEYNLTVPMRIHLFSEYYEDYGKNKIYFTLEMLNKLNI